MKETKNYYSQHGEDYLLDLIFGEQVEGFFVEVGCIDGRRFSNTLTFEERGWQGICVEAHDDYIESLRANRPGSAVYHCAAAENDEEAASFYANERGSLSTLDSSKEEEFTEDFGEYFSGFDVQQVPKRRIDTVLSDCEAPTIDFLSLDIEGYEVEALSGMDLDRWRPRVLVIESDSPEHEERLDERLLPEGYVKGFRLHQNIFYFDDAVLIRQVPGGTHTAELVHTRHPCDEGTDETKVVSFRVHKYGRLARAKRFLRRVRRKGRSFFE